jgi:hypothetical protein
MKFNVRPQFDHNLRIQPTNYTDPQNHVKTKHHHINCNNHNVHSEINPVSKNSKRVCKNITKSHPSVKCYSKSVKYELYIQSYHHHKWLVPEQHTSKHNPTYPLIYNWHNPSHPTTDWSILRHPHNKKPVPSWSCQQPHNINGMFNKFTLCKNLLHFLKYFYYLISFNIIWNFTDNKMFYAF